MSLCVVAFPDTAEADAIWLQSIRAKYDPQFDEINPHITLLLPSKSIALPELEEHVKNAVLEMGAFDVVFRCVLPYRDPLGSRVHLFLVPDVGLSDVVRLHDRICERAYPGQPRVKFPFIPHVTIGAFDDGSECRRVADLLNSQRFEIAAQVCTVSIVSGSGVAVIHREIGLGNRSA